MINKSPSTVYSCALLFSSTSSWLHQHYISGLSYGVKVIKGRLRWGKCFRIVKLQGIPFRLACWKNTLAVSNFKGYITILDTVIGSQMAIHSEHTKAVTSLTFSQDGTLLVSGSKDTTIKLWDMQTGGVIKTFNRHTNTVSSVSISADCATIASGSHDCTIRLWNVQTGECYCIMQQRNHVLQVHFFPTNPRNLISVCHGKIQQWNIDGQKIAAAYDGICATFSLDGAMLAFFNEEVFQVQNSDSGAIVAKFDLPVTYGRDCCFSPNGRLVAIVFRTTAYVWNITSPGPPTLITHGDPITSLVFSSPTSLISITHKLVNFWQIDTLSVASDVYDSPIQSITLQAKDGIAVSSDSDGIMRIWNLLTGLCNVSFQTPAKGSCRRDIKLIDNQWILVWCTTEEIHIWAIEKEEPLKTVNIYGDEIEELRISGDGSKVFYISHFSLKGLCIQTGDIICEVKLGFSHAIRPFLTMDGSKVWMYANEHHSGWDFRISDSIESCILPPRHHLDFIHGIRESRTHLPLIEDTITGKKFLQLPRSLDNPTDAQWDGQYLVAGYDTGEVLILKCNCTVSH